MRQLYCWLRGHHRWTFVGYIVWPYFARYRCTTCGYIDDALITNRILVMSDHVVSPLEDSLVFRRTSPLDEFAEEETVKNA